MQNSKSQDGTDVQQSDEVEVSTSSPNNAKPIVGCCTSLSIIELLLRTIQAEKTFKGSKTWSIEMYYNEFQRLKERLASSIDSMIEEKIKEIIKK